MSVVLSTFAILLSPSGYAQQNSATVPSEQAQPVTGPADACLGEVAHLKVPAGYSFYDPKNAIILRESLGMVKGLVGFLKSEAGGWEVLLQFDNTGYVKTDAENPAEVTKALSTLAPPPNLKSSKWHAAPDYNPGEHALDYAISLEAAAGANSSSKIQYTAQLLGRGGVLNVIATCDKGFDRDALRDLLVKGITFNAGQRYADFHQGDPLSTLALTGLVGYGAPLEAQPAKGILDAAATHAVWVAVGGVVVILVVACFVVFGRARRRVPKGHSIRAQTDFKPASVAVTSTSTKTSPPDLESARPTITPKAPNLKSIPAQPPATPRKNAVLAKKLSADSLRKKRAFDYNRYFADLMSTVSTHGPTMEAAAANGFTLDRNGSTPPGGSNIASSAEGAFTTNTDLIAHQTTLIEEQRRLILEQSKLIEEKSKLIAEKNHLLKLQAELIENKML